MSDATPSATTVRGLAKTYGDFNAVESIDRDISPITEWTLNPPLTWRSFVVERWLLLTLVAVVGVLLPGTAIRQVSKAEWCDSLNYN